MLRGFGNTKEGNGISSELRALEKEFISDSLDISQLGKAATSLNLEALEQKYPSTHLV